MVREFCIKVEQNRRSLSLWFICDGDRVEDVGKLWEIVRCYQGRHLGFLLPVSLVFCWSLPEFWLQGRYISVCDTVTESYCPLYPHDFLFACSRAEMNGCKYSGMCLEYGFFMIKILSPCFTIKLYCKLVKNKSPMEMWHTEKCRCLDVFSCICVCWVCCCQGVCLYCDHCCFLSEWHMCTHSGFETLFWKVTQVLW